MSPTNGTAAQIVAAYEGGMTIQQIAEDLCASEQFDETTIKTVLASFSSVYRNSIDDKAITNENKAPDLTDTEFDDIKRVAKELALFAEDDNVRARMIKFLWDEKKGRNDAKLANAKRGVKNLSIVNVRLFNEHLKQARQANRQEQPIEV